MHVVVRLFFWLTLFGTALALVAPALVPAAGWDEAQPVAFLGLLVTLLLAWASARTLPSSMATDPYVAAKRRRTSGIAYSVVLMVVLAPLALVALNEAQQDLRSAEYDAAERLRRIDEYGQASPTAQADEHVREAEAGELTSFAGLVVAGIAFIGLLASASRRLPQQSMPVFQTTGAPYQAVVMAPYPHHYQAQFAPPTYGPQQPIWSDRTIG